MKLGYWKVYPDQYRLVSRLTPGTDIFACLARYTPIRLVRRTGATQLHLFL